MTTKILWCVDHHHEQEADQRFQWLTVDELRELAALRHAESRRCYVAGRRVAKQLVSPHLPEASTKSLSLYSHGSVQRVRKLALPGSIGTCSQDISILSRDRMGRRVAPKIHVLGKEKEFSLSISHTSEWAAAAMSVEKNVRVGIDLTRIETHPPSFARTWFTKKESSELDLQNETELASGWAAKEAAFKSSRISCPFAPLRFRVSASRDQLGHYHVHSDVEQFTVHTVVVADHVVAIATLELPTYFSCER